MSGTGNSGATPTPQSTQSPQWPTQQTQSSAWSGQPATGGQPSAGYGSNPYLTQSISDALGDTVNAYNKVVAPGFTSANVGSGSFGNSGIREAQADSLQSLQTTLARQANDMRSGQYQFDRNMGQRGYEFDRSLGQRGYEFDQSMDRSIYNDTFAQNQQGFANAMALLGMQNQFGQQALGYGNTIQDTPLNYYNQFTNTANSIGQGFSSASTSGSGGSPLMGALGGAQLGGLFGGGGWGGTPLGGFFYGNGTSGD